MTDALAGIRVIDLTMWFQGPVAGQHLADFGAEVIHVERPQGGDLGRGVRSIKAVPVGDWNQYFLVINRNKKSLALNLNTDQGREVMYKLVAEADVFLTNLTSENLEKWQVTYDHLRAINPRLVYAMCSGFGPFTKSTRPSFDLTVQALTGIMTRLGEPGQPPIYLGMGSGDAMGGLMAAYGIMVALHARRKTNKGQFLDASLYGAQLFLAAPTLQPYLATRDEQYSKQQSRNNAPNPLWNTYPCSPLPAPGAEALSPLPRTGEGSPPQADWVREWFFLCMPNNQESWVKLTSALEAPDLTADPRFATPEARAEHNTALIAALDTVFAKQTRAEWLRRFRQALPTPAHPGEDGVAEVLPSPAQKPETSAEGGPSLPSPAHKTETSVEGGPSLPSPAQKPETSAEGGPSLPSPAHKTETSVEGGPSLPSPAHGRGTSGAAGLGEGITAAPINNLADLAEDPQAWANSYFTKTHCDEVNREVTVRGLPITLSKTPGAVRTLGPELGQHTEEILTETLGYTWEQVGELKDAGAIL
jgi:crotonobetainyl-CoA:carnitine CoA-transferase CaiB-like acyl-CoA transferase